MRERVKRVMSDVFGVPAEEIPDDADAETLESWDSLGHMSLMLALEAEFNVSIPSETMLELLSVEEITAFLDRAGSTPQS